MSGTTGIEWADKVWNPVTGCTKVSEGCRNCYAEAYARRFWGERKFDQVVCHEDRLDAISHWRKPVRIFVNSMSDLFHPDVPDEFIWKVFERMTYGNRRHTYMILTKRPERMKTWFEKFQERFWHYHAPDKPQGEYVAAPWPDPCIWLGVSVENQAAADERIPLLLQTPAAVRFVSVEPMLGPVDMEPHLQYWPFHENYKMTWDMTEFEGLDWVICGGESGPHARPMHPDWVRALRDQCIEAGVPFFFKQWGDNAWDFVPLENQIRSVDHWIGKAATWIGKDDLCIDSKGMVCRNGKDFEEADYPITIHIINPEKGRRKGRLLDGVEWNQVPEIIPPTPLLPLRQAQGARGAKHGRGEK
jgi:protein gp37